MARKKAFNPFYLLLSLVGVVFCVTASAYGVMVLRTSQATAQSAAVDAVHPLQAFIGTYGNQLLLAELVVLGIATVGAIGTDQFWEDRFNRRNQAKLQREGEPG